MSIEIRYQTFAALICFKSKQANQIMKFKASVFSYDNGSLELYLP